MLWMSEPDECDCPEPTSEESWQYRRVCALCGAGFGSNHCPHDGVQKPCPTCGWIEPGKRTPLQFLGLREPPPEQ